MSTSSFRLLNVNLHLAISPTTGVTSSMFSFGVNNTVLTYCTSPWYNTINNKFSNPLLKSSANAMYSPIPKLSFSHVSKSPLLPNSSKSHFQTNAHLLRQLQVV